MIFSNAECAAATVMILMMDDISDYAKRPPGDRITKVKNAHESLELECSKS